jgi:glyoxylase-like metal-dependent hydrolase (beta-lactamase superfamily II)
MLNCPNENFVVLMMPGNVLAIAEPLHEQCIISFMIFGQDMILLLDTCTGILDLSEVVDYYSIYDVTVLNSHDHFDHIGGNSQFDEVWCYDLPSAVRHLTNGPTETEQAEILGIAKSVQPVIRAFGYEIPEKIPGKAPTGTVKDGQIIDLGGRELEVIHTPGHQPSCIMLLDRENHLLFTGDMFYPGPMYCMFSDSSFPDYVKSIRKAVNIAEENGVEQVYTSHNLPTASTEDLRRFADFLERIEAGEITDYQIEDGYPVYAMDEVYSISVVGEGQEPMVLFDGADGK